jgi:hypothetical protein
MVYEEKERGIYWEAMIHAIFWLFILVLALSFFGISIKSIISSPAGQENFGYLLQLGTAAWAWIEQYIQQFKG